MTTKTTKLTLVYSSNTAAPTPARGYAQVVGSECPKRHEDLIERYDRAYLQIEAWLDKARGLGDDEYATVLEDLLDHMWTFQRDNLLTEEEIQETLGRVG